MYVRLPLFEGITSRTELYSLSRDDLMKAILDLSPTNLADTLAEAVLIEATTRRYANSDIPELRPLPLLYEKARIFRRTVRIIGSQPMEDLPLSSEECLEIGERLVAHPAAMVRWHAPAFLVRGVLSTHAERAVQLLERACTDAAEGVRQQVQEAVFGGFLDLAHIPEEFLRHILRAIAQSTEIAQEDTP